METSSEAKKRPAFGIETVVLLPYGFVVGFIVAFVISFTGGAAADRILHNAVGALLGMLSAFLTGFVASILRKSSLKAILCSTVVCGFGGMLSWFTLMISLGGVIANERAAAIETTVIPAEAFAHFDLNHDGIVTIGELDQLARQEATYNQTKDSVKDAVADLKKFSLPDNSAQKQKVNQLIEDAEAVSASLAQIPEPIAPEDSKYVWYLETGIVRACGPTGRTSPEEQAKIGCTLEQLQAYPTVLKAKYGSYYWWADRADSMYGRPSKS